jgi:hypothetical protein
MSLKFNFKPVIAALLRAILTVISTVDQATEIIQSLYWKNGAINYTLPLLFITLYIGLHLRVAGKVT